MKLLPVELPCLEAPTTTHHREYHILKKELLIDQPKLFKYDPLPQEPQVPFQLELPNMMKLDTVDTVWPDHLSKELTPEQLRQDNILL